MYNGVARILKKVTHIKGRLLYQVMILYYNIPFEMGTSLTGKNLLPEGGILSFKSSSLRYGKSLKITTLGEHP